MHCKTTKEFNTTESNRFLNTTRTVILGNEGDLVTGDIQDAPVGNRNSMGVLTQIFDYMIGTCQRRLTMDDPPGFPCFLNVFIKDIHYLLPVKGTLETVKESAFKVIAQLMYRIEVFSGDTSVFPATLKSVSCCRYYAMDVWVKSQILSPGMKYGDCPAFNTIVSVPKGSQSVPHSREKQIIIEALVVEANPVQLMWQSEYKMVMLDRESVPHQIIYPECLFYSLTFWTMPVSATVIAVSYNTTTTADFLMATQSSSAATDNLVQYP